MRVLPQEVCLLGSGHVVYGLVSFSLIIIRKSNEEGAKSREWGCLNRLLSVFLIWFGFSLGLCVIFSGAGGIYLFFNGEKEAAIFSVVGAVLLIIGTIYFLVLGVIGLFRPWPGLNDSSSADDEWAKGDRIFTSFFGGLAGVVLGTVGAIAFSISGDWQAGVSFFGCSVFILSLIGYLWPEAGGELGMQIFEPVFALARKFVSFFI